MIFEFTILQSNKLTQKGGSFEPHGLPLRTGMDTRPDSTPWYVVPRPQPNVHEQFTYQLSIFLQLATCYWILLIN